ncbi:MAG: phosphate-starvation-inducible PsiE family protein [Gammaproteobacteria bacterium]|nr:phosphate-starvation-inducible PsiE family protein [Gammaproteobacteria bacterium]
MTPLKKKSNKILELFEFIGLSIISLATFYAFGFKVMLMVKAYNVTLADLLLLFIYLEIIAMVIIYLKSGKLPVRVPLYIAIVALARFLIIDLKSLDITQILGIGATIILISLAILIIRYGHSNYPYNDNDETN